MGNNMMKYSFVVPVYNSIQYIETCLESMTRQTFHDYEILFVDDGSTDGTAELCDHYAEAYKYIRVVHKENGGPASARNTGIRESKGEFIWFIDSDDAIADVNALQEIDAILDRNKNIDIIYFLSNEYNSNLSELIRRQQQFPTDGCYSKCGAELLVEYGAKNALLQIATSPVNKVFRRDILIQNNLFFPEKYRCYEEDEFLCKAAYFGKEFYFLNDFLYSVRVRPESVSTTRTPEVIKNKLLYRIELVDSCEQFYSDKESEVQKTMNKFYSYYLLFSLRDSRLLENESQKREVFDMLNRTSTIYSAMWNTHSKYLKIIAVIHRIFGVKAMLRITNRG